MEAVLTPLTHHRSWRAGKTSHVREGQQRCLVVPTQQLAQATANEKSGRGGIRTHGEFNPTFDFESSALNRAQPLFLVGHRVRSSHQLRGQRYYVRTFAAGKGKWLV